MQQRAYEVSNHVGQVVVHKLRDSQTHPRILGLRFEGTRSAAWRLPRSGCDGQRLGLVYI